MPFYRFQKPDMSGRTRGLCFIAGHQDYLDPLIPKVNGTVADKTGYKPTSSLPYRLSQIPTLSISPPSSRRRAE